MDAYPPFSWLPDAFALADIQALARIYFCAEKYGLRQFWLGECFRSVPNTLQLVILKIKDNPIPAVFPISPLI